MGVTIFKRVVRVGLNEKLGNTHEEQWESKMNKGGAVGWAAGS